MRLAPCPDCNRAISRSANVCPHCGRPISPTDMQRPDPGKINPGGVTMLVIIVLLVILFFVGRSNSATITDEDRMRQLQRMGQTGKGTYR